MLMNVQLVVAGVLALVGAGIHGIAGELLVVRRLVAERLPPSALGGPRMTRAMIHASWHIATVAFVAAGAALLVAGAVLEGDAARALAVLGAAAVTGYAAVVLVLGASALSVRAFFSHPAPLLLTVTAALAWWGAL